ncbi:hypothetical protein SDC9_184160 [bioreactor metagenome]|uniref:Uncharacterized protein n=1 Tax=bioreactor metagenome TaxID=1076179 RepID=A0A645HD47_9ZZZZ
MDSGGNHVIARLTTIDMVIRMDRLVAPGKAEHLQSPVGNHLVCVHVRRGPGARLKYVHHEFRIEFALCDLSRGRLDAPSNPLS